MRCPLRARCPRLPSLHPTPTPSPLSAAVLWGLSPTPGSPRKSFWLDESSFGSPTNHTTCLTALGGSLHSEGSTNMATNKQCVRASKMDVVAQSCGPTADPCYLRLMAQPLATLPTSCSSFSTHFTLSQVFTACTEASGPLKAATGIRMGAGTSISGSSGNAIWHRRRGRRFGACQIRFLTSTT